MWKKAKDSILQGGPVLLERAKRVGGKVSQMTGTAFSTTLAFFAEKDFQNWIQKVTESVSSIYDKALDPNYLRSKLGGGTVILDGQDLLSALEKLKASSASDKFSSELIGSILAIWKSVAIEKGLPFQDLNPASFEEWANKVSDWIPKIGKEYLYDLLNVDAMELFSTALGAVAVLFAFQKNDQEKLAEILGSMGIISIISANPVMGIFVTAIAGYSYWKEKKQIDKKAFLQGAVLTGTSAALFAILGLPVIIEFIIVMVVTTQLKKQVFDNEVLMEIIKRNLPLARENLARVRTQLQEEFDRLKERATQAGQTAMKASKPAKDVA